MTTAPVEPGPGGSGLDEGTGENAAEGVPAGDPGVVGPAEDTGGDGDENRSTTPPGYPDEVDPARGPVADRTEGSSPPVRIERD